MTRRFRGSVRVAAALIVVGVAASACGTTQLGAAAITGTNRITSATLTNQVANLTSAYQANQAKGIKPQRPVDQAAQQVLTWLILFNIYDKVAEQHNIHVTPNYVNQQLNKLRRAASQSRVTLAEYVSAAGALPPDLVGQLGQYIAIQTELARTLNGGQPPTTASAQLQTQVLHAQCVAAKSLGVQVNPQFGVFDYRTYAVVPVASKLAADPVPSPSASKPLVNPPC